MSTAQPNESYLSKPLRLWPGVVAAVLQLLFRFGVPLVSPDHAAIGGMGGVLFALVILVWWAFFSRAPRLERWGGITLMVAALAATPLILHESIVNGMMGMMFYVYAIPVVSLALVAWAVLGRRLADGPRRAGLVAAIVLACGVFALLRTDGILGAGGSQLAWRWTPTAEERLLAEAVGVVTSVSSAQDAGEASPQAEQPSVPGAAPVAASAAAGAADAGAAAAADTRAAGETAAAAPPSGPGPRAALQDGKIVPGDAGPDTSHLDRFKGEPAAAGGEDSAAGSAAEAAASDWPGFRGRNRDGRVAGTRIETNWTKSPPVELWRRSVGPGWSSFAVQGNLIYTQEQRGEEEVVACYNLATGQPVWLHRDPARFWESNAGAGPRGTPTVSGGRVYSFGATGILNALDARTGAVAWTRNASAETGVQVPYWGFASSPLVVDDVVIVAVAGQLAAYDLATGEPRWTGPAHGDGYASPHRLNIDGVTQVLLLSSAGATSVAPGDGSLLWEHSWGGFASLQPVSMADGDLLITSSTAMGGQGTRRLRVAQAAGGQAGGASQAQDGWTVEELWTSNGLKPYFNDVVIHEGHAYGFDGRILSCIDLTGGERRWKGGRYGNGQLILLQDQDLLLVLSDEGEVALVAATPDEFREVARFPALEGKTWNHPALAGDILLVRNDREMAAFRMVRAE